MRVLRKEISLLRRCSPTGGGCGRPLEHAPTRNFSSRTTGARKVPIKRLDR
jgi:hypothetical protein